MRSEHTDSSIWAAAYAAEFRDQAAAYCRERAADRDLDAIRMPWPKEALCAMAESAASLADDAVAALHILEEQEPGGSQESPRSVSEEAEAEILAFNALFTAYAEQRTIEAAGAVRDAFAKVIRERDSSRVNHETDKRCYAAAIEEQGERNKARAELDRAVELLHMLDKPDARHPDVAAFLDALEEQ